MNNYTNSKICSLKGAFMDNQKPIGIFDSGIGGLTVLNELQKILPHENFIYYADTRHLPYGDKSKEEIISYSEYIVKYFIENDVKAIVIACGTASALAFETLKNDYDVPIFNVIDSTVNHLNSNNIGIIATCASISSNVWDNKILEKLPNANITKVACPKLVPLAENGLVDIVRTKPYEQDVLSSNTGTYLSVSASSDNVNAYKMFDGLDVSYWESLGTFPQTITATLDRAIVVEKFAIKNS